MRNLGTASAAACSPQHFCKKVFGKFWQRGRVSNAQGGERPSQVHGGSCKQAYNTTRSRPIPFRLAWFSLRAVEVVFSCAHLTTRQRGANRVCRVGVPQNSSSGVRPGLPSALPLPVSVLERTLQEGHRVKQARWDVSTGLLRNKRLEEASRFVSWAARLPTAEAGSGVADCAQYAIPCSLATGG